jgi:hypothetical protein
MGAATDVSPIADGAARVRVVQASVDLPEVNVVAKGSDVNFATQLAYPRSSDYSSVPAGTYDLQINVASSGETAAEVSGVVLEGDNVYDLIIIGDPGDDDHPVTIVSLQDSTANRTGAGAGATPAS